MSRKSWRDLSLGQRIGAVLLGAVEVVLFGAAELDIRRRPASLIRGPKGLWTVLAFVNILGPLAYFAFGRKGRGEA
jgi:hypothetical protein